jgi:hypothetical protein
MEIMVEIISGKEPIMLKILPMEDNVFSTCKYGVEEKIIKQTILIKLKMKEIENKPMVRFWKNIAFFMVAPSSSANIFNPKNEMIGGVLILQ